MTDPFARIDTLVRTAIEDGKLPGCVVTIGRRDEVLFRRAYGWRALLPERVAMTEDTVFDLASLTKPIATATGIMKLVDQGLVALDAPASRYVPELAPSTAFTVEHLLVHTSGLPAAMAVSDFSGTRAALMHRIGKLTLKAQPGERFVYSDVGYVVLEEIVRRVSHIDLATYANAEIFAPLGMVETRFLPDAPMRARAATTEQRSGVWMQGEVHDPRAHALGGIAGHAGVFSTTQDLTRFAQMMLRHGEHEGTHLVRESTFRAFTSRHLTPKGGRGLGWDIDSVFANHKSDLLSPLAFGHGGYTGTAMWIDPEKDFFVVFLSNRVHPEGKGAIHPLVSAVTSAAVDTIATRTGVDVLANENFSRLRGSRVGLITNVRSTLRTGQTTIDAFRNAAGVSLVSIFSPEHGLGAQAEGHISDTAYEGIPVRSLYGTNAGGRDTFSPTDESLSGIDTLVFDLQDAGLRFYTYASTMKRAMQAAARMHLRFVVLDRPNPLGGDLVEGPLFAEGTDSFASPYELPIRHGLTLGELANFIAAETPIALKPEIVTMSGWHRADHFGRTTLKWPVPSPNLRTLESVELYPAVGLLEATNVSVGRGTEMPFEVFGAPWVDADALVRRIRAMNLPGIEVERADFTPNARPHANTRCHGVRVRITDRSAFRAVHTGVALAIALYAQHPKTWNVAHLNRMLRSDNALVALRSGRTVDDVEATWSESIAAFDTMRRRYFLYP